MPETAHTLPPMSRVAATMKWAENYAFLKTTGGSISGPLTVASLTVTGGATLDGATATTPATPDNSTNVATTAFVKNQGYQTGNQTITLSGDISGSGTTAITTTLPTVNGNVGTFQGITVNAKGQVTAAASQNYAPLASPTFTGTPAAPTPTAGDNSTRVATTAYVANYLPLAGGSLTGTLNVNPTIVTTGPGQVGVWDTGGAKGGAISLMDTGAGAGNGGAVELGAGGGSWRFAAIKGYLTNGGGNSQGAIAFFTRAAAADATLTNTAALFADGGFALQTGAAGAGSPGSGNLRLAGGIVGVGNASNAAAGNVGEFLSALNTAGITCPAGTLTTIATLALTAGDWDVYGEGWSSPAGTAGSVSFGLNTSAADPPVPSLTGSRAIIALGTANLSTVVAAMTPLRISASAATTIYLFVTPTTVAVTGYGKITARRIR